MTQSATGQPLAERHSHWDDGVYYPSSEERTVPISDRAWRLMAYVYMALNALFEDREDVYVGADQFFYWEPGDTGKRLAPDGYVIFGVPKRPLRTSIRVWQEAPPGFVLEVSNASCRTEDRGHKLELYRDALRVPEYLIFDDDTNELLLYRLEDSEYVLQQPDARGRLQSRELGVGFGPDPELGMRLYDPEGDPIPWSQELFHRLEEIEEHRNILIGIVDQREAAEAHLQEQLEAERQRADALAAELESLRRQLREGQG